MTTLRRERDLLDDGIPPPPPPDLPPLDVDEGPMRGDLRRQIGELELSLATLQSSAGVWKSVASSPTRGPAVLSTADLEQVRDELIEALRAFRHKLVEGEFEWADEAVPAAPPGPSRRERMAGAFRRISGRA